jgi:hypothetical protein
MPVSDGQIIRQFEARCRTEELANLTPEERDVVLKLRAERRRQIARKNDEEIVLGLAGRRLLTDAELKRVVARIEKKYGGS